MKIPGADISASASIDHSLGWNFHMLWTATDVSDWLLRLVPVLYKHAADNQSFISYFQHILVDCYGRQSN